VVANVLNYDLGRPRLHDEAALDEPSAPWSHPIVGLASRPSSDVSAISQSAFRLRGISPSLRATSFSKSLSNSRSCRTRNAAYWPSASACARSCEYLTNALQPLIEVIAAEARVEFQALVVENKALRRDDRRVLGRTLWASPTLGEEGHCSAAAGRISRGWATRRNRAWSFAMP
jgi:hypothetical protein